MFALCVIVNIPSAAAFRAAVSQTKENRGIEDGIENRGIGMEAAAVKHIPSIPSMLNSIHPPHHPSALDA